MVVVGGARVTPPLLSTGQTACAMYTFHACGGVVSVLGSENVLVPYQTESERPGPPATIHGKTLTFAGAWLICTGVAHFVQPVAALATVVNTWYVLVVPLTEPDTAYVMCRLRPLSIDATVNNSVGLPASPLATVINPVRSAAGQLTRLPPMVIVAVSSRKQRSPEASMGVPMLSTRVLLPPSVASKTLPVI